MNIPNTPMLRNTLIADALTGLIAAAVTILGAGVLAPLLDLPERLIFWAGVLLLPIAVLLLAAARRQLVPRGWLREIVFINCAWVAASLGLMAFGAVQPNLLGLAFVVVQALAVGIFAAIQASVLRSGQAVSA